MEKRIIVDQFRSNDPEFEKIMNTVFKPIDDEKVDIEEMTKKALELINLPKDQKVVMELPKDIKEKISNYKNRQALKNG